MFLKSEKSSRLNCLCFRHSVLELTDGIEDLGGVKWDMFGTLFLSWIIVFLCLCKGLSYYFIQFCFLP